MTATIPRAQWGARHPNGSGPAPLPAREVYLHHSVTIAPDLVPPFDDDDAAVRTLETIGQQRFGQGISYTWPITPTGRVYEGHSVDRLGAHTKGRNGIARAICFVGNYDVAKPTAQQIEAAAQLLVREYRAGHITAARITGGHQQAPGASTACPGRHGMAAIPAINARAAAILAGAPARPTPEEDDMPHSPTDIARFASDGVANRGIGVRPAAPKESMEAWEAWSDAAHYAYQAAQRAAGLQAAVSELTKTIGVLVSDRDRTIDVEALATRLDQSVRSAVADSVIDVDVTVRDVKPGTA